MNSKYFSEQAQQYDFSDFNQPSRKAYINAIDELIANDLAFQRHQNIWILQRTVERLE